MKSPCFVASGWSSFSAIHPYHLQKSAAAVLMLALEIQRPQQSVSFA